MYWASEKWKTEEEKENNGVLNRFGWVSAALSIYFFPLEWIHHKFPGEWIHQQFPTWLHPLSYQCCSTSVLHGHSQCSVSACVCIVLSMLFHKCPSWALTMFCVSVCVCVYCLINAVPQVSFTGTHNVLCQCVCVCVCVRMHVCVCVHVWVYACACGCMCVCVSAGVSLNAWMCVCMHAYVHACICEYTQACTPIKYTWTTFMVRDPSRKT